MIVRPLVSVVIPTRNSARFLAETLESVAAQTFAEHEIVVVDAGSADDTCEIARRHPKARIISQRSTGLSGAWNEGIAAARGELVAFLDSDDLWHPRKLELQAACLADHPDVDVVATRMRFFLSPGEVMPPAFRRLGMLDTDHATFFPGNLLVRRQLFRVVGGFDPGLAIAGDVEWFARIQDLKVGSVILPETLYFKRLHAGNLSHGRVARETWSRELAAALRASILRRRKRDVR
jgi:glycosyltransferase involved in cell wall biosynthesis